MSRTVNSLKAELDNVAHLLKTQLVKVLTGAVRSSQGSARASWKAGKGPNWWREGDVVDAHDVTGVVPPFTAPKNLDMDSMKAALITFYESRIHFETKLKPQLGALELAEIAGGKNPYPPAHYAENGNTGAAQEEEAEESDANPKNNEGAKDVLDTDSVHEQSNEALAAVEEPVDQPIRTPVCTTEEEVIDEGHADDFDTGKPHEEEAILGDKDDHCAEVEGEKPDAGEDSDGNKASGVTDESCSQHTASDPSKSYDLDDLEKLCTKLRKKDPQYRLKYLAEIFETAMKDPWIAKNYLLTEPSEWLNRLSLQLVIARALVNLDDFKRETAEELKHDNERCRVFFRLKPPHAIRNITLKEFQQHGGTVEEVQKHFRGKITADVMDITSSSSTSQSAATSRRTARKNAYMRTPMAAVPTTGVRRTRRTAAQASTVKTQAMLQQGTPLRAARPGEKLVPMLVSVNGSPVETGVLPEKSRDGLAPIAPVPFGDDLATLNDLSTLIASAADPDALKEALIATARKAAPKRGRR